jgi:hypothetical protein
VSGVRRTIEVRVDPATAFAIFTEEIDEWFVKAPRNWRAPDRAIALRFEPGVGGRWLEVWSGGGGAEWGRITAWEPGRRLALDYWHDEPGGLATELEIRFEPAPAGTRVILEHSGWERLPPELRAMFTARAWGQLMAAYERWLSRSSP